MNECNCGQSTNPNGLGDGFGDNICQEIIYLNENHKQSYSFKYRIKLSKLVKYSDAQLFPK